jgi:hypothetical protein
MKKTVEVVVLCPHREEWRGFYAAGVHWPEGETRAKLPRETFEQMVAEIVNGSSILTVTNRDTGEVFAPVPPPRRYVDSREDRLHRKAQAMAIKREVEREEAARLAKLDAAALAQAEQRAMQEAWAERRRQLEAEDKEIEHWLKVDDERKAAAAERKRKAAEAAGIQYVTEEG